MGFFKHCKSECQFHYRPSAYGPHGLRSPLKLPAFVKTSWKRGTWKDLRTPPKSQPRSCEWEWQTGEETYRLKWTFGNKYLTFQRGSDDDSFYSVLSDGWYTTGDYQDVIEVVLRYIAYIDSSYIRGYKAWDGTRNKSWRESLSR